MAMNSLACEAFEIYRPLATTHYGAIIYQNMMRLPISRTYELSYELFFNFFLIIDIKLRDLIFFRHIYIYIFLYLRVRQKAIEIIAIIFKI